VASPLLEDFDLWCIQQSAIRSFSGSYE